MARKRKPPRGLTLLRTLAAGDMIPDLAFSPDGALLAVASRTAVRLFETDAGRLARTLGGDEKDVLCLAWSPDGTRLATGASDARVKVWDPRAGKLLHVLEGHGRPRVFTVAWSPHGNSLASGGEDSTFRLWEPRTGKLERTQPMVGMVMSIAWSVDRKLWFGVQGGGATVARVARSPVGRSMAEARYDGAVRLILDDGSRLLEGHTDAVTCVAFSHDGRLLASKSTDKTVRLWRVDTGDEVARWGELVIPFHDALAFHPTLPLLATCGEQLGQVRIWQLDVDALLGLATPTVHYTNAKVVLVGDSGVGKSGLALVLTGQPFRPTESTHGRRVHTFSVDETAEGTRETLLWDLAGQPGYRLIHQRHLHEVAVAVVVFDAKSETDPFAGVRHWERALRVAERVHDTRIRKLLVAARIDRGGVAVSRDRIDELVRGCGFDGFVETSAADGRGIADLVAAIQGGIDWVRLPRVASSEQFQRIKSFLLDQKKSGRTLAGTDDLFRAFTSQGGADPERAPFDTCIGLVEARGLIRRLPFGGLVLLQPELLDGYASALVDAARAEPDGLGSIPEADARSGRFPIPRDVALADAGQQRLLLEAVVEDLLRHEIALREHGSDGAHLVFPSQLTRERPDLPDATGRDLTFSFEGALANVYATLVVRLSRGGVFARRDLWKDAATFGPLLGGTCGLALRAVEEGRGELSLFFDRASVESRLQFEEFVRAHLERRALAGSVSRRRIVRCGACQTPFTDEQVARRLERGLDSITCTVCDARVSLTDTVDFTARDQARASVAVQERAADLGRKRAAGDFDVFLCHHEDDAAAVRAIAERLMTERGILPWWDNSDARPGLPWQRTVEEQIERIGAAAVFVGARGVGPWQAMQQEALLREFVERNCPVIPVLLDGAGAAPRLPAFLRNLVWVDFRARDPDPLERLAWGITGRR